jgi:hypothetical protein
MKQCVLEHIPPSSFAMTSALSSIVVYAMELLELPKEIPMAVRSPGVGPFVTASSDAIVSTSWKHYTELCQIVLL